MESLNVLSERHWLMCKSCENNLWLRLTCSTWTHTQQQLEARNSPNQKKTMNTHSRSLQFEQLKLNSKSVGHSFYVQSLPPSLWSVLYIETKTIRYRPVGVMSNHSKNVTYHQISISE